MSMKNLPKPADELAMQANCQTQGIGWLSIKKQGDNSAPFAATFACLLHVTVGVVRCGESENTSHARRRAETASLVDHWERQRL
jgi:hypothetical protein